MCEISIKVLALELAKDAMERRINKIGNPIFRLDDDIQMCYGEFINIISDMITELKEGEVNV